MALPSISVINFAPELDDREVQNAIRSVNRQVLEDFAPIWGSARELRLHAPSFDPAIPDVLAEDPVRGESVIYLVDKISLPGALGYHDLNSRAIPVGFVFILDPSDWTVTLSHEVLELIIDPTVNIFVPGPDPRPGHDGLALHTYEVCDAVERTAYSIDGVLVSNFLTPSYFTIGEEIGTRNDFLGVGVDSFGVTPGSHIAFFDLAANKFVTVNGQRVQRMRPMARNPEQFIHDKPARPEELMQSTLDAYHEGPHKKVQALPHSGLSELRGISRGRRYRESAARMGAREFPQEILEDTMAAV